MLDQQDRQAHPYVTISVCACAYHNMTFELCPSQGSPGLDGVNGVDGDRGPRVSPCY